MSVTVDFTQLKYSFDEAWCFNAPVIDRKTFFLSWWFVIACLDVFSQVKEMKMVENWIMTFFFTYMSWINLFGFTSFLWRKHTLSQVAGLTSCPVKSLLPPRFCNVAPVVTWWGLILVLVQKTTTTWKAKSRISHWRKKMGAIRLRKSVV